MDIHSPCGQSVTPDSISLQDLQSSGRQERSTGLDTGACLVNVFENSFGKFLRRQDAKESDCASNENDTSVTEKIMCEDLKMHEAKSAQKCLTKAATFPCPNEITNSDPSSNEDDSDSAVGAFAEESKHPVYSQAVSMPTPLKLVSAMKGSREKHGLSLTDLTVKWAPDVYDPPPTIVSHTVVKGKKQQKSKNSRKTGKNKHKGENKQKGAHSSRGNSGNDKKQLCKIFVSSNTVYKSLDAPERILVSTDYVKDFNTDNPESYCGSDFLHKSFSKVHYSIAGAS